MSAHLTYPQSIILGLFQGVTELFPVSSLGHSVLIPALLGWNTPDLSVTGTPKDPNSPYLAFIVAMHVATAIAMIIYFWRDWLRIIKGFLSSLGQVASPAPGRGRFEFSDTYQKLAWMIVLGTVPVGLAGVALDHTIRSVLAKPVPTAIFLILNGLLLFGGEFLRRRRAGLDAQQAVAGSAYSDQSGYRDRGYDDRGGYSGSDPRGSDPRYRDDPRRGGSSGTDPRHRDDSRRGGQSGRDPRGYDPRGYGQPSSEQSYGDRGNRSGSDPRYRTDPRRSDPRGYDQGNYGQGGGGGYDRDPRRDDPWGDGQFGYDRRGDHGGLGPRGYGDGGGMGGGPRGNDPGGNDPWGDDARRDDPWGDNRGGFDRQGYGQQGYEQQGYEQQGHYQGSGGRRAARHSGGERDYGQAASQHGARQVPAGRRAAKKEEEGDRAIQADERLVKLSFPSAIALGASQILALFPGFSRDGSVMVAGLARGLSRQDAARFSFLLSAPVILAAGVFKAGELAGPETKYIHGPIIAGSIVAGIGAYFALMFLDRFLSNPKRTLTPFAIYCVAMGLFSLIYLGL